MRNLDLDNITEAFLNYFGDDVQPRTQEILTKLVRHLHAFAKEVNLTHDEWRKGIDFLTWAGRITDDERNEFVLLSDVFALSSLVDLLQSHSQGTSSSVLGPFHISNAPQLKQGADFKG